MLGKEDLKPILEALIFAADSALGIDRIAAILEGETREAIKEALEELVAEYAEAGRGFTIEEVAGGYQYRTNPDYAPYLRRLFKIGLQRISKPAMEALAIVAYKQPVTRAELEAIRGVDSGGVLATLMDKRFIKIVGRKELPGRPVVYGTTKDFLETFDLKDLSCLPSLKDIQKMEEENGAQDALPEEEDRFQNEGAGEKAGTAGPGPAAHAEGGGTGAGGTDGRVEETGDEGLPGGDELEELEDECLEDIEELGDDALEEFDPEPGEDRDEGDDDGEDIEDGDDEDEYDDGDEDDDRRDAAPEAGDEEDGEKS